jgi:hypothetical protein
VTAKCSIIAALVVTVVLAATAFSADPPTMKLRVTLEKSDNGAALRAMGFEGVYVRGNHADLFTDANGLASLQKAGLLVEVLIEDAAAYYAEQLAEYDGMGGYKTLSEVVAYLDGMIADHPDILSDKISIGLSIEGRDIWAVKISDNPSIDEDEPEAFFNSLIHANEPITVEALLYFMDHLTDNYGLLNEITMIVDNRELWFVPVVNPDGYYYNEVTNPEGGGMWRKNRRDFLDGTFGVDLNRNFGYEWGYKGKILTSDPRYPGTGPFSEPETQAIRDFVVSRNFVISADYHTGGSSLLWPWMYNETVTPDEDLYRFLVDYMVSISTYRPIGQLEVHGCSWDWEYGEQTLKQKILAIGVEIGNGELWPDPSLIPGFVSENLGINLFLCRAADSAVLADSLHYLLPPNRPTIHVPQGNQEATYTVAWSHDDTVNAAVVYELLELQDPVTTVDSVSNLDNWNGDYIIDCVSNYTYYSPPTSFRFTAGEERSVQTKEPIYIADTDYLKFWTNYLLTEGEDYGYVQVSTDNLVFEAIPGNITTNEDPYGQNLGNGVTGESSEWIEGLFDLSSYAGQNIWIRFVCYRSTPLTVGLSFFADDIYLVKKFGTETIIASDLTDTMFNFTDKPEGDYYYRVRALDAQVQWGGLSNFGLVSVTGEPAGCCEHRGDADGSDQVDVLDVDYLIDYFFRGGPPPACEEEADADDNDQVDVLDVDYLINYFFRGGPPPVPCP